MEVCRRWHTWRRRSASTSSSSARSTSAASEARDASPPRLQATRRPRGRPRAGGCNGTLEGTKSGKLLPGLESGDSEFPNSTATLGGIRVERQVVKILDVEDARDRDALLIDPVKSEPAPVRDLKPLGQEVLTAGQMHPDPGDLLDPVPSLEGSEQLPHDSFKAGGPKFFRRFCRHFELPRRQDSRPTTDGGKGDLPELLRLCRPRRTAQRAAGGRQTCGGHGRLVERR